MRTTDHELGLQIRSICLRNAGGGLNRGVLAASIADLLEGDTFLLTPLRDLVSKPGFEVLVTSDLSATVFIAKEAILSDISATYHPSIVSRLSVILEGILGADSSTCGSQSGYRGTVANEARGVRADVAIAPNSDVPFWGGRKAVWGASWVLAGLGVAVAGGFVVGRIMDLASPEASDGVVNGDSSVEAPLDQGGEADGKCAYQEKAASELRRFGCVITHFQTRDNEVGTKVKWSDGEVSKYLFSRDGAFRSWYKERPDSGSYALVAESASGQRMVRLEAVLDGDVTWLPMASLPWRR